MRPILLYCIFGFLLHTITGAQPDAAFGNKQISGSGTAEDPLLIKYEIINLGNQPLQAVVSWVTIRDPETNEFIQQPFGPDIDNIDPGDTVMVMLDPIVLPDGISLESIKLVFSVSPLSDSNEDNNFEEVIYTPSAFGCDLTPQEAGELILASLILENLPPEAVIYLYPEILLPETTVESFDREEVLQVIRTFAFFAMIVHNPLDRFSKPVEYLFFDCESNEITRAFANWWPTINSLSWNPDILHAIPLHGLVPSPTPDEPVDLTPSDHMGTDSVCALLVSGTDNSRTMRESFRSDIRLMKFMLSDSEDGPKLSEDNITIKHGIGRDQIEQELDNLRTGYKKIYFYYSGHGVGNTDTRLGSICSGDDPDDWYSYRDLYKKLGESEATDFCVVLDCCFAGSAVAEAKLATEFEGKNLEVYSSSNQEKTSSIRTFQDGTDSVSYGRYSFAFLLCYDGDADVDNDGLEFCEVHNWLIEQNFEGVAVDQCPLKYPADTLDLKLLTLTTDTCHLYSEPLEVSVTIGNQNELPANSFDVILDLLNLTDTNSLPLVLTQNISPEDPFGAMEIDFTVTEFINDPTAIGHYSVTVEIVSIEDADNSNNSAQAFTKIIYDRNGIAALAREELKDQSEEDITYLSKDPLPQGTKVQPLWTSDEPFVVPEAVYLTVKDHYDLARLGHPFSYVFYNLFGEIIHQVSTNMPPRVNGEQMNLASNDTLLVIDGITRSRVVDEDPTQSTISDSAPEKASREPDACLILVSGHETEDLGDIAFRNDLDLMEMEFRMERNGHTFDTSQIFKLVSPTIMELSQKLEEIKMKGAENKSLYFIYSGHGFNNRGGGIILDEGDAGDSLFYADLAQMIGEIGAPVNRVIIDACYSGSAVDKFSDVFFDAAKTSQQLSLYTSSNEERPSHSFRARHLEKETYFSQYLYAWAQAYGIDFNDDGKSTMEEIHTFITFQPSLKVGSPEVSLWAHQKPLSYKNGNAIVVEGTEKERLGRSKVQIFLDLRDQRSANASLLVSFEERPGLPTEDITKGVTVDSVFPFQHWKLNIENIPVDSTVHLFFDVDVRNNIEHTPGDLRMPGLVFFQDGAWHAIPSEFDEGGEEVIARDFSSFGTVALGYTDSVVTDIQQILAPQVPVLKVSPNPSRDQFRIHWPGQEISDVQLHLYDAVGKVVLSKYYYRIMENSELTLKLAENTINGIYWLRMHHEGKVIGGARLVKN